MIEYADWETGETQRLVERVDILEQQRAELLEALKLIKDHPSNDAYEIRQYAVAAITRTEAAE